MSGQLWIYAAIASVLPILAIIVAIRRHRAGLPVSPAAQPAPLPPERFNQPEELHERVNELREELGPQILPSLLKAALSDLERHLAVFDKPGQPEDEDRRRALHSFVGIVDTVGCSSLAQSGRELQERQRLGDPSPDQQRAFLTQIRLLHAEISTLLEQELSGAESPHSGG